jgi:hypothetical protein
VKAKRPCCGADFSSHHARMDCPPDMPGATLTGRDSMGPRLDRRSDRLRDAIEEALQIWALTRNDRGAREAFAVLNRAIADDSLVQDQQAQADRERPERWVWLAIPWLIFWAWLT